MEEVSISGATHATAAAGGDGASDGSAPPLTPRSGASARLKRLRAAAEAAATGSAPPGGGGAQAALELLAATVSPSGPLSDPAPALARLREPAAAARARSRRYGAGAFAFGALLFLAGAAPGALPAAFLVFALTALPWRLLDFLRKRWAFFIIDFCYFVNVAAALFLLFAPDDARLEALVYALADGPLAGALAAWQCAWVFDDAEHVTSVLMHLLPGLAIFANRYHTPPRLRGWRGLKGCAAATLRAATAAAAAPLAGLGVNNSSGNSSSSSAAAAAAAALECWGFRVGGGGGDSSIDSAPPRVERPAPLWPWLVAGPLLFYLAWQALYFLIVQVLCRGLIRRGGYDTVSRCSPRPCWRPALPARRWRHSLCRQVACCGNAKQPLRQREREPLHPTHPPTPPIAKRTNNETKTNAA